MKFYVNKETLIPRSSFDELIEKQLETWVVQDNVHRILDLCTGSGCIAVAAAMAFPEAKIDAIDISETALKVARKNIADHGLDHQRV